MTRAMCGAMDIAQIVREGVHARESQNAGDIY